MKRIITIFTLFILLFGFPYITYRVLSFQSQGDRFTRCDWEKARLEFHNVPLSEVCDVKTN